MNKNIYRIIDANINRLNESLRVIEDMGRFVYNDKKIVKIAKEMRHYIKVIIKKEGLYKLLLNARDVKTDNSKYINLNEEFSRNSFDDILIANIKRIQESCRVLEEVSKLLNENISKSFKKVRFKAYLIEKKISKILKLENI